MSHIGKQIQNCWKVKRFPVTTNIFFQKQLNKSFKLNKIIKSSIRVVSKLYIYICTSRLVAVTFYRLRFMLTRINCMCLFRLSTVAVSYFFDIHASSKFRNLKYLPSDLWGFPGSFLHFGHVLLWFLVFYRFCFWQTGFDTIFLYSHSCFSRLCCFQK